MPNRPRLAAVDAVLDAHPFAAQVVRGESGGDATALLHFFDAEPITAQLLERYRPTTVVVAGPHAGAVDLDAAAERGVSVVDTPGLAANAVAEYTITLLLALLRGLPAAITLRQWLPKLGRAAQGQVLGIVGLGAIGIRVAALARSLGMQVLYWEPVDDPGLVDATAVELPELLRSSDVVSVHLRLVPATRGLLDAHLLPLLKPTALLINTARSEIVDTTTLRKMLAENLIGGAALDVFDIEPLPPTDPLWQDPRVLISPHMAWMTTDAVGRFFDAALRYLVEDDRSRVRAVAGTLDRVTGGGA